MKKIILLIVSALFIAIIASSCTTSSKCAAYGDVEKYQKEVKY
jgi:uncharacterized alpha/beta hydrolase family protein